MESKLLSYLLSLFLTPSRTGVLRQRWAQAVFLGREGKWLSSSASFRDEEGSGGRKKVPLNAEWEELARKQLKGADPAEKLTWRTAEVRGQGVWHSNSCVYPSPTLWHCENQYQSIVGLARPTECQCQIMAMGTLLVVKGGSTPVKLSLSPLYLLATSCVFHTRQSLILAPVILSILYTNCTGKPHSCAVKTFSLVEVRILVMLFLCIRHACGLSAPLRYPTIDVNYYT